MDTQSGGRIEKVDFIDVDFEKQAMSAGERLGLAVQELLQAGCTFAPKCLCHAP
jgi:hypothetical protein